MNFKKITISALCLSIIALSSSGCTPATMAIGAGATAGVSVAQDKKLKDAGKDAAIKLQLGDKLFKRDIEIFQQVSTKVFEGRVLLTGVVQNPMHRVEAARLAWQIDGVQDVINEIKVQDSDGIFGYSKDTWITTQLKTQLTFDREVKAINYTIETVAGTVYLLGIARTQTELDHVMDVAKNISYVKDVVSYVRLKSERPS